MLFKKKLVKRQITNGVAVPIRNTDAKDFFLSISFENASRLSIILQRRDMRIGIKFGVFL